LKKDKFKQIALKAKINLNTDGNINDINKIKLVINDLRIVEVDENDTKEKEEKIKKLNLTNGQIIEILNLWDEFQKELVNEFLINISFVKLNNYNKSEKTRDKLNAYGKLLQELGKYAYLFIENFTTYGNQIKNIIDTFKPADYIENIKIENKEENKELVNNKEITIIENPKEIIEKLKGKDKKTTFTDIKI